MSQLPTYLLSATVSACNKFTNRVHQPTPSKLCCRIPTACLDDVMASKSTALQPVSSTKANTTPLNDLTVVMPQRLGWHISTVSTLSQHCKPGPMPYGPCILHTLSFSYTTERKTLTLRQPHTARRNQPHHPSRSSIRIVPHSTV